MDATIAVDASWSIPIGTPVYDVAGEKLGSVSGFEADALLVDEGFLFVTTHAVPMALVSAYEDGRLVLAVTKAQALGQEAE
jgi:hypothetical protein